MRAWEPLLPSGVIVYIYRGTKGEKTLHFFKVPFDGRLLEWRFTEIICAIDVALSLGS